MSCEIYLDSNAEEWSITVENDTVTEEMSFTVEVGGNTIPVENDPVFLAHPVYAVASGDVTRLQTITDQDVTNLQNITATDITEFHAPYSDAETSSTIGTLLGTQSAATPEATDVFPFVQAIGNTLKKITTPNLRTQMQPSLSEYLYFAGAYTADAVGDWRMGAGASGFVVQYCSASGSSKGTGTWEDKFIIEV